MADKAIEISSNKAISMPIFNLLGIIGLVASAVFTFNALTNRITALETQGALILNDISLLQEHIDTIPVTEIDIQLKESALLLEFQAKRVEALSEKVEDQLPLISKAQLQVDFIEERVLDLEELTDKLRGNGIQ
tara:strand:- start:851 stop:1252 length:402 start_codon:yes stop_codon:yes gene_type:complete